VIENPFDIFIFPAGLILITSLRKPQNKIHANFKVEYVWDHEVWNFAESLLRSPMNDEFRRDPGAVGHFSAFSTLTRSHIALVKELSQHMSTENRLLHPKTPVSCSVGSEVPGAFRLLWLWSLWKYHCFSSNLSLSSIIKENMCHQSQKQETWLAATKWSSGNTFNHSVGLLLSFAYYVCAMYAQLYVFGLVTASQLLGGFVVGFLRVRTPVWPGIFLC
jgi:hypothetical protein